MAIAVESDETIGDATALRPRIALVVNGTADSAMGMRAAAFAERLGGEFSPRLFFRSTRRIWSTMRLAASLVRWRPQVCYVLDMAASGVIAAGICKLFARCRVVIDTGDAITALAWSLGRGPIGRLLTQILEWFSFSIADRIVVRGSYHQEWLRRRGHDAEFIPDGVALEQFECTSAHDLRRQLGLEHQLTIGLIGSSIWSKRLGMCYGWDLVELIRHLKDRPIAGVMIGVGNGIPILQEKCRKYGIENRIHFLGRAAANQLPTYVKLLDICLSTQTNDLVGNVRTTGKLPLYLAAGRFVLASRVGEAARILPPEMLVDYCGTIDPQYPRRLADRIEELIARRADFSDRPECRELARRLFDYDLLTQKLAGVLKTVAARIGSRNTRLTGHNQ